MKHAIRFAFWVWVGYAAVTQVAPYVQAKLQSLDIDDLWDVYSEEWAEE